MKLNVGGEHRQDLHKTWESEVGKIGGQVCDTAVSWLLLLL